MGLNTIITNDDGVFFPSINALHQSFLKIGKSNIVAPNNDCTGIGQAISLFKNITMNQHSANIYGVDGYPVDCIGLALNSDIIEYKPDLIISGINKGVNMGSDIWYSGTLGAARHAYIHNYKAIAFSCGYIDPNSPFSVIADFAVKLATFAFNNIEEKFLLNVNYPTHTSIKGIKWTKLGKRIYKDDYKKIEQKDNTHTFSFNGSFLDHETIEGSDFSSYKEGYISITPLCLDAVDYNAFNKWSSIKLDPIL